MEGRQFGARHGPPVPPLPQKFQVLWDFVGFGVVALAGSRECVPAEASTPPEFLKTQIS